LIRRVAACLAAVLALGGCAGIGSKGSAREGGTIEIGVSRSLDSLDPGVATSPAAREALWQVYTPPVAYAHTDQVKLVPGVAAALPKSSAAGTRYSFRLRRGLRYSNDRPVRAADVAHALRRSRALSHQAARIFAGVRRVVTSERTRRVTIDLRRPDPDFPYALASTFAAPVPRSTPLRDMTRRPPPGVGPYAIVRSRPGRGFTLRRNEDFDLPGLPHGYVTEISARPGGTTQEVIDGRLDYVQDPPPAELLPDMRSKYREQYSEHVDLATLALQLDARRPPLDDERVRTAVAHATDPRELAVLDHGFLEPSCNLLPPAVAGYKRLDPCPWGDPEGEPDLVKASELIENADATAAEVTVGATRSERRLARELVSTLRKIGMRPRLVARRAEVRLVRIAPALPIATSFLSPAALRSHAEPGLPPQAVELSREPDPDRAAELAGDLDRAVVEAAAAVPIGYEKRPTLLSRRMDARNCAGFNPVYGNDWASFCLQ
jgi:peptide/nickel transport system substrate-binding protein